MLLKGVVKSWQLVEQEVFCSELPALQFLVFKNWLLQTSRFDCCSLMGGAPTAALQIVLKAMLNSPTFFGS